ncbi:MAG: permease prefix domain 1-containing protein [Desemzia incerta]|uniref:permease prefix domain 1-containing protein n=1 Tax=Desemzia incerta TaxID=82801 RepID=UPI0033161177
MDTIRNYVESVFVNLPRTPEMQQLKEEMLRNMEEKYFELLDAGKSDNEAIGAVLADFGNIDEIMEAYDLESEEEQDDEQIYFSQEEADEFMQHRTKFAMGIAAGVFLCITAPAVLLLIQGLYQLFPAWQSVSSDTIDIFSVVPLLLMIAVAVGIFVNLGMKEDAYKLDYRAIKLENATRSYLQREKQEFQPRFAKAITLGVVMCILAPAVLLFSMLFLGEENELSVVFLLSFVAVGVFLFVFYGILYSTYERLLAQGDYTPEKLKAEKVSENVSGVVFPIAAGIYVLSGFLFDTWSTAWIIFPIVGILFAIFTAAYSSYLTMKQRGKK